MDTDSGVEGPEHKLYRIRTPSATLQHSKITHLQSSCEAGTSKPNEFFKGKMCRESEAYILLREL
jgi:hypothetical protein